MHFNSLCLTPSHDAGIPALFRLVVLGGDDALVHHMGLLISVVVSLHVALGPLGDWTGLHDFFLSSILRWQPVFLCTVV